MALGDKLTGRQERKEARDNRREAEAQARQMREKEINERKRLDAQRIRSLRSRSQKTLFDLVDDSADDGRSVTGGRSSLLG